MKKQTNKTIFFLKWQYLVLAKHRFSTHEYQGQVFQEILATDIVKINK